MTDVNVETEEIHTHASSVDHIAARVQNCATFGKSTDFGLDTFGIIGQVFALGCRDNAHQVAGALDKAAGSVRDVKAALESTAETYKSTESDNTNLFSGGAS